MTIYNCQSCKKDHHCPMQNEYARVSLFAFGRNAVVPDCSWYQPDCWHGIDGVTETHRAAMQGRRPRYHHVTGTGHVAQTPLGENRA